MAQMGNLTYYTRINPDTGIEYPAESRQKVFISYRKVDSLAGNLCGRLKDLILEAVDCAVWYDSALTPGENYDTEINNAIRSCDVVVLLLTEHILDSTYVWENEIPWAKKYKKRVIPIEAFFNSDIRARVEQVLGHIQFCLWNYKTQDENDAFITCFSQIIKQYVTNANTQLKIEQLFAAGKHKLSGRYLTLEDKYYIGLGYLKGIGTEQNIGKAEKMLKAIIEFSESDAELEEIKNDAVFQVKSYYSTQILSVLENNQRELIYEHQEHGEAFGIDVLHELGQELMSVADSPFKKNLHVNQPIATGAMLLRIRVDYLFGKSPLNINFDEALAAWAHAFSGYVLHIISSAKGDTQQIWISYFLKYCNSMLSIISNWNTLAAGGTLEKAISDTRNDFIAPITNTLQVSIDFDLYKFSSDLSKVKEQLLCTIIWLLKPLYTMDAEVSFALGHFFYDGVYSEKEEKLGDAFFEYGCLVNPSKREERNKLLQQSHHNVQSLYPAIYEPEEDAPVPTRLGELTVDDVHFYFIKVSKNKMYLMRDEHIIKEFPLLNGGGDCSSFEMSYNEDSDALEILNYEVTHYDKNTSRYLLKITDLLEDELHCEEVALPDLEGIHRLTIY
ncbi:MAG: toll/interleukin-1 receptor domain-containing protein [Clostridia bacterium]|nr:toll/interleukin-1 receptor domain-containing protein [Clostridia bacterium]